jgi:hypothetical protein
MKRFKEFSEEIAMSVGSGAVAGMPTASPPEQTPVGKGVTTKKKMLRRISPDDMFGGIPVFKVRWVKMCATSQHKIQTLELLFKMK